MLYTDQIIACVDCATEFPFTAKEQEFYAQKGFTSTPKRCKPCRNARKDQAGSGGGASRSSSGGYGSSSGYGDRAPREREMHKVTCGGCGTETEVPFKPRGDRPVYCRPCYSQNA
jgi:CxxC-x17-CxxC domain-containing protein